VLSDEYAPLLVKKLVDAPNMMAVFV